MIRVKISNFIKNNKNKISNFAIKLIIVAMVVLIATIILSAKRKINLSGSESYNVENYKPTETAIKGSNISEEQYKKDTNIIDYFLEYCNSGNIQEAYMLISDECKESLYPSIEVFKTNYYNSTFNKKRTYNLQTWISNSNYTTYKIRYSNDMLSTGVYNKNDIYEDYITMIKKQEGIYKISLGSFIYKQEINKETTTSELSFFVKNKTVNIEYEEYEIKISNKTDKTIVLDTLETSTGIVLNGKSKYKAYINNLFKEDLNLNAEETKTIKIKFNKKYTTEDKIKSIQFLNVIKDYNEYLNNNTETFKLEINV